MKYFLLIAAFLLFFQPTAWAASKEALVKKGNAHFEKGQYSIAIKQYQQALKKDPESPVMNFNLGTALYKNTEYQAALPYLQKGLLSDDVTLKKDAHFNLGNTLFAAGLENEKKEINTAVNQMEESLRNFDSVIKLDDKDQDAEYNYQIVAKELARLKKEQEKQQEQKPNDQKQNDQKQPSLGVNEHTQPSSGQNQKSEESQHDTASNPSSQDQTAQQKEEQNKDESSGAEKQSDAKLGDISPNQQADPKEGHHGALTPRPGEMGEEEAKNLLKQFEQNEQPSGLLNFGKQKSQDRPVLKDW